jgi:hypothetical protein
MRENPKVASEARRNARVRARREEWQRRGRANQENLREAREAQSQVEAMMEERQRQGQAMRESPPAAFEEAKTATA